MTSKSDKYQDEIGHIRGEHMKGLVLNNIYTVEKSIKSSMVLASATVLLLLFTQHAIAFRVAIFLPFALIPVHAFEVLKHDSKSGWSKFEITLPVNRQKIIRSKYITFLLLLLLSTILTFLLFYAANIFIQPSFTIVFFNFLLRGMGIILCIATLNYPLTFLLGTEKSDAIQIYSIGFALGVFGLMSLLVMMVIGPVKSYDQIFSMSFLLISMLLFLISYVVSNRIYKHKEF